ncbi:hypothetical protein [Actinomadura atramentaria]|uniref:hypothetical protein n=1 Tax=Actinomadura atramentaria TaxID=1990 RepID=UPI0003827595|nr:hypothetical protein [Actinomadura atramentaria]
MRSIQPDAPPPEPGSAGTPQPGTRWAEPRATPDGTWTCRLLRPLSWEEEARGLLYVVIAKDRSELAALMALEDEKAARSAFGPRPPDPASTIVPKPTPEPTSGPAAAAAAAAAAEEALPEADVIRPHLEALRGRFAGRKPFRCRLVAAAHFPDPFLRVINLDCAQFAEDVRCRVSPAGLVFVWSWGDAIGSVRDVDDVAAAIVRVLSPQV